MSKSQTPRFVAGIFCDSVSKGEGAKVDCKGVFTSFLAWAYPTSVRSWNSLLTVYDLPEGTTTITASISRGKGKKKVLGSVDAQRGKEHLGNLIHMALSYRFPKEGVYTVHFNVVGSTRALGVPVLVATQPWERITGRQRDFLKKHPSVPHSIRMAVFCSNCPQPYMFEENVLPEEALDKGVLPFPGSGSLECSCGHVLQLKDSQGQLRSSIKTGVTNAMRGRK